MIKVLLADDSPLVRAVLLDIFHDTPDVTVVGEATNGREAVEMTTALRPHLVVMDIMMPVMDGLEAIEEIMANCATPILVLTATLEDKEVNYAFQAIKKGALDVMAKPSGGAIAPGGEFPEALREKVRLLSKIRVIHHLRRRPKIEPVIRQWETDVNRNILAIGASTGGPKAVMSIIKTLPHDFPAAVFVVQHIASGFAKGFAQWLDRESRIKVRLAKEGDLFEKGEVLVAPNDSHMVVERGKVRLIDTDPVNCCKPSVDVFFRSLAAEHGKNIVAVLLTGMGRDGAEGLKAIRARGGLTLAQDEESSAVFGMPKAAISIAAVDEVVALGKFPAVISRLFAG
jgi:two-component system chemotaxis response regulator CheB